MLISFRVKLILKKRKPIQNKGKNKIMSDQKNMLDYKKILYIKIIIKKVKATEIKFGKIFSTNMEMKQ